MGQKAKAMLCFRSWAFWTRQRNMILIDLCNREVHSKALGAHIMRNQGIKLKKE